MNCFFTGLMLEHHLGSSPNINATSGKCLFCWAVSGRWVYYIDHIHVYWRASRDKTLNQCWLNAGPTWWMLEKR